MIPKRIHQIWVGPYEIPQREKNSAEKMKSFHPDYEYFFWTDNNLPEIPPHLRQMYDTMYQKSDFVYCADMLRILTVFQYGGYYFDIDFECIKNLNEDYTYYSPEFKGQSNIEFRTGVLYGHWGVDWKHCDYSFANNTFGFEKEHPLLKYLIDNMGPGSEVEKTTSARIELNYGNCPYSPGWFGIVVKSFLGLKNDCHDEIWQYHKMIKEKLLDHKIEYGHYNAFENKIFKHHAAYSWSLENKKRLMEEYQNKLDS
jgi:hypothetical protein